MIVSSKTDLKAFQQGGRKLSKILKALVTFTKVGINLLEIESLANELIYKEGGEPAFKRVPGYQWTTCININSGIVHGVPRDYQIKDGDIVSIDIGMYYQGFNTDTDYTFLVAENSLKYPEKVEFLKKGKEALKEALIAVKLGNYIGQISQKIQEVIEGAGYKCARNLTGHGIGRKLHEDPLVPCFLDKKIKETPKLKRGMVLAIEVIYTQGKPEFMVDPKDKWTISTRDGRIAAVFEETVVVGKNGLKVLTPLPFKPWV